MKNVKTAEEILKSRLHFEGETNDKWWLQASVKCFLETGKVSGTLFTEIKTAMEEHTNQFKPEWVSVECVVLPEDGDIIFTCSINHEYVIEICTFEYGKFWFYDNGKENTWVTHYMPLPQPPQK